MVCPYCGSKLAVSNSRPQKRTNSVWRRRHCPQCHNVFTSIEQIDPVYAWVYQGSKKAPESFQRDILFISVYEALKHRKTADRDATALTETIIRQLSRDGYPIKKRAAIVAATHGVLARFDQAAAIHYQAYHPATTS